MPRLVNGVVRFQQEIYPAKRALFEKLALEQTPEALFITCSDSRIDPGMVTQTDPGALFICRNAGNIVPPHTNHTGATTAAVEFAVGALKVPHIVVCGHTGCGALEGAMDPASIKHLPHVTEWLGYARAALQTVHELGADMTSEQRMQLLVEQNVLLQMHHLRTHPHVVARLAADKLTLHGWIYDIRAGRITAWDDKQKAFVNVAEHYSTEASAS